MRIKIGDPLPQVSDKVPNAKIIWRQLVQLREESRRLRWELARLRTELHVPMGEKNTESLQVILKQEPEMHPNMNSQIVPFAVGLKENEDREVRQEIDTAPLSENKGLVLFVNAIDETPVDTDIKSSESIRGSTDTREMLYLIRAAQRKALQLEHELYHERHHLRAERQHVLSLQNSVREQAQVRYRMQEAQFQVRWKTTMMLTVVGTAISLFLCQMLWLLLLHIPLTHTLIFALLAPLFLCMVLAVLIARIKLTARLLYTSTPHKRK